jgi:hypothetical protein
MQAGQTREDEEIWVQAVDGRVWLEVGGKQVSVARRGQKIRMTVQDRERIQEMTVDPKFDVFTNGTLYRLGDDQLLTDDRLAATLSNATELGLLVQSASEVVMRRLQVLCRERDVSLSVNEVVNSAIRQRFPLGGSQPVYDQMVAAGDIPSPAVM